MMVIMMISCCFCDYCCWFGRNYLYLYHIIAAGGVILLQLGVKTATTAAKKRALAHHSSV